VSAGIVLGDQAGEGNDDAPVRRVESDRRLDDRQVVVEVSRADCKELEKESKSIASEGLEGHCEESSRETKRGREEVANRWQPSEFIPFDASGIHQVPHRKFGRLLNLYQIRYMGSRVQPVS
jgi:hypothetical protein